MSNEPPSEGRVTGWLNLAKGLTLTNALVIMLILIALVPAYMVYTVINDPAMMGRFLSSYEEITSDKTPCVLRIASLSGGGDTYAVSTGFAYQGSDKWVVSVILDRKPDDQEIHTYCETLQTIVNFMRRPDAPSPKYPNSDEPLIWQYPTEQ